MHVAMVDYQGEKMSKSLGNLVLASEVLDRSNSDAFRLYLHSNHYRTQWAYDDDGLEHWVGVAARLAEAATAPASGAGSALDVGNHRERFIAALNEDLDTPAAITSLQAIAATILQAPEGVDIRSAQATLRRLGSILGLTLGGLA